MTDADPLVRADQFKNALAHVRGSARELYTSWPVERLYRCRFCGVNLPAVMTAHRPACPIEVIEQEVRDLRASQQERCSDLLVLAASEAQADLAPWKAAYKAATERAEAAEAHREAKIAALREYGRHKPDCRWWVNHQINHAFKLLEPLPETECTCGLDEALSVHPTTQEQG